MRWNLSLCFWFCRGFTTAVRLLASRSTALSRGELWKKYSWAWVACVFHLINIFSAYGTEAARVLERPDFGKDGSFGGGMERNTTISRNVTSRRVSLPWYIKSNNIFFLASSNHPRSHEYSEHFQIRSQLPPQEQLHGWRCQISILTFAAKLHRRCRNGDFTETVKENMQIKIAIIKKNRSTGRHGAMGLVASSSGCDSSVSTSNRYIIPSYRFRGSSEDSFWGPSSDPVRGRFHRQQG